MTQTSVQYISGAGRSRCKSGNPFYIGRRKVRVSVESDRPVDVALAYGDFSSAGHKEGMTEGTLGPFDTKDYTDMALFLGVYPGDRATVSVRVWTDKK